MQSGRFLIYMEMKFTSLSIIWTCTVCVLIPAVFWLVCGTTTPLQTRYLSIMHNAKTCEMAEEMAHFDFDNASFFIVQFGMPEELTVVAAGILKNDYGLQVFHGGCANDQIVDCYNFSMTTRLIDKFGEDIFKKSREKAKLILLENK
jgi:hypothetical protein